MKRGRPRSPHPSVDIQVHLRLDAQLDADLIAFFASIADGQRSNMLKAALRAGGIRSAGQVSTPEDEPFDPLDSLLL